MLLPERIEVSDGSVVTITWEDGRVDAMTAQELREHCPCAGCREGHVPHGEVTVAEVHLVGDYALGMTFLPEGHRTGIFPFPLLRGLRDATAE